MDPPPLPQEVDLSKTVLRILWIDVDVFLSGYNSEITVYWVLIRKLSPEFDLVFFRVSITGLTSSTKYSIRVSAVNGVSNISNIPVEFEEGQYTTKASTQTILNFQISSRSQTEITITWDIVSSVRNQVMFYQVRSAPRLGYGDVLLKNISANHQNYTFKNLNLGSEYSLQVIYH